LQAGAALSKEQHFLLHGALNNLLGYPHNQEASWSHWLSMPPEVLDQLCVTLEATGHEAQLIIQANAFGAAWLKR
jgi:hypothetical protein